MAIIDWDQFNENFQYYDQETIREVIEAFLEEYEERLNELECNITDVDYTKLAFHAHSLKSVIGNFMAPKPFELCRHIEEKAKQNSMEGIPEKFSALKLLISELTRELTAYLKR